MRQVNRLRARRAARVTATILTATALLIAMLAVLVPAGADEGLDDPTGTGDTTPTTAAPGDPPPTTAPVEEPPPTTAPVEGDAPPTTTAPAEEPSPTTTTPSGPRELASADFDVSSLGDVGALTHNTGTVTVNKVAPAGGPFPIQLERCTATFLGVCTTWVAAGAANLVGGGSQAFTGLTVSDAGSGTLYRLTETVPNGWRLTGVACSGGSSSPSPFSFFFTGTTFRLTNSALTRDCTFTNAPNTITVTKETVPDGVPQAFAVDVEMCSTNILLVCVGSWTDVAGSPASLSDGQSASYSPLDGTLFDRLYRVREETLPPGWTLDSVTCGGSGALTLDLGSESYVLFTVLTPNTPGDVSCTVTNSTDQATITVAKTVVGADRDFTFDLSGGVPPSSPPLGNGDDFTWMVPATGAGYELSEQTQSGYSLTSRNCIVDSGPAGGSVSPNLNGNAVDISPIPGQAYTCTYTNLQDVAASLAITKTASPTAANVGDTVTYTYQIRNTGPVAVGSLALADDKLGAIPLPVTQLLAGQSTTATATYVVQPGDAGNTIVNVATLTGIVPFPVILANGDVGADALNLTATAQASVAVTAVGGAQVAAPAAPAAPAGAAPTGSGTLPRTGSDGWWMIRLGIGLLIAGTALGLVFWRRYRRRTLANLQ